MLMSTRCQFEVWMWIAMRSRLFNRQDRGLRHQVDPAALFVEVLAGVERQTHGVGRFEQVRWAAIGCEGVHRAQGKRDAFVGRNQPFGRLCGKRDGARIFLEDDAREGEVAADVLAQGLCSGLR